MTPTRRHLVSALLLAVATTTLTAAPWAICTDSFSGRITLLDFSTMPPRTSGPLMEGQLGSSGGALLDVAVAPDGRFALLSNFGDSTVHRINLANPATPVHAGVLTTGFYAEDIAIAPNGRFAIVSDGGFSTKFAYIDLTTFATSITHSLTSGFANACAIAPDNQTVLFADFSFGQMIVCRLDPAGNLLSEYALPAGTNIRPVNVSIAPDGQTVLLASGQTNDFRVPVFQIVGPGQVITGTPAFVTGIGKNPGAQSFAFSPLGDKAYVLQNGSTNGHTLSWLRILGPGHVAAGKADAAKLYAAGISSLFGVDTLDVSPDGAWAVVGNPTTYGATNALALVNLKTFAVTALYPQTNALISIAFVPEPRTPLGGDFDGDGLADPSLYDARTGTFQTLLSGFNYFRAQISGALGGYGWAPAAADYDGDRLADPGVYQERTGNWSIRLSSTGYARTDLPAMLGGPGWKPAVADYDGDGRADPGVYETATKTWKVMLTTAGYAPLTLPAFMGGPGFGAIPADYDGDGLADPAVYTLCTGDWRVKASASGYADVALPAFLGGMGRQPAPADYDGDRLADPAFVQTPAGLWVVRLSSGGYALVNLPELLGRP